MCVCGCVCVCVCVVERHVFMWVCFPARKDCYVGVNVCVVREDASLPPLPHPAFEWVGFAEIATNKEVALCTVGVL